VGYDKFISRILSIFSSRLRRGGVTSPLAGEDDTAIKFAIDNWLFILYYNSRYSEPVFETQLTMNVPTTYLLFNHGCMIAAVS